MDGVSGPSPSPAVAKELVPVMLSGYLQVSFSRQTFLEFLWRVA